LIDLKGPPGENQRVFLVHWFTGSLVYWSYPQVIGCIKKAIGATNRFFVYCFTLAVGLKKQTNEPVNK
jgi:hypothetical protein